MKLVFFGHDLFAHLLDRLSEEGHLVCRVYSCPSDEWSTTERVRKFATKARIPMFFHRPRDPDIWDCAAEGAELLISAAYPYRIPATELIRGINVHPTRLPEGRGRSPLTWIILRYPEEAAITVHKLSPRFDEGDILVQRPICIDPLEDMETLSAKLQLAVPGVISDTIRNLDNLWTAAKPQAGPGSYWPPHTASERTLSGDLGVAENLRIVRAFGNFGALVAIDGATWKVTSASGWHEAHAIPQGTIAHCTEREAVLAVRDGFIVLRQFSRETAA